MSAPDLRSLSSSLRVATSPTTARQAQNTSFGSVLGRGVARAGDAALPPQPSARTVEDLRRSLHQLNMQVATAPNPLLLGQAVDRYLEAVRQLAEALQPSAGAATQLAAPFIPGGAVISAAVNGLANTRSGSSG
jgi:hypothetical protein